MFINKVIEKLVEERLDVAYQKTRETTKYDEWVSESISLSILFVECLGEDIILFDRYEELSSVREGAFLKNAYAQGFRDGVELLRELLHERKNKLADGLPSHY